MIRRNYLLASAGWLAAACGGGSQPAQAYSGSKLFSIYSDSSGAGSYSKTSSDTERSYLAVRPMTRMLQNLPGWQGIDHSIPGWTIMEHSLGWDSAIAVDPADVIVIRLGGGDALVGTDYAKAEMTLTNMVVSAQSKNKKVVLVGVISFARTSWWDYLPIEVFESKRDRATTIDAIIRRVAITTNTPFVDIRALPFNASTDIIDAVHPAQDYSNRCADAIASTLGSVYVNR